MHEKARRGILAAMPCSGTEPRGRGGLWRDATLPHRQRPVNESMLRPPLQSASSGDCLRLVQLTVVEAVCAAQLVRLNGDEIGVSV